MYKRAASKTPCVAQMSVVKALIMARSSASPKYSGPRGKFLQVRHTCAATFLLRTCRPWRLALKMNTKNIGYSV